MKTNCWEFKKCGRELGGSKVNELGICPAAVAIAVDGINSGKNGGRCCWAISGTLCDMKVQGCFTEKMNNCMRCNFFKLVSMEERASKTYVPLHQIMDKLK